MNVPTRDTRIAVAIASVALWTPLGLLALLLSRASLLNDIYGGIFVTQGGYVFMALLAIILLFGWLVPIILRNPIRWFFCILGFVAYFFVWLLFFGKLLAAFFDNIAAGG